MTVKKDAHTQSSIIISISSDIAQDLSVHWGKKGHRIIGTYHNRLSDETEKRLHGIDLIKCNLSSSNSVDIACKEISQKINSWDNLIIAAGVLEPIGTFIDIDFEQWSESLNVNFTNQLRIVHHLLPYRNPKGPHCPQVLFFAGGGTNNATLNYSSYTLSKIGLIKMCELLDAEISDCKFSIIGPGWVKTKIHNKTINNRKTAGLSYEETIRRIENNDFVPMQKVLDCCDWIINSPREIVSGRNFSVANDYWGSEILDEQLKIDKNMYKLRRYGNNNII